MMDFLIQSISPNLYVVSVGERSLGMIRAYRNPSHNRNLYLALELDSYPIAISPGLFSWFQAHYQSPLQVMVDSGNEALILFLKAGGFICARKCYDCTYSSADLVHPLQNKISPQIAHAGTTVYHDCAKLLYNQYKTKHEAINPLTKSFDSFVSSLPANVYYSLNSNKVESFAFVEEDEIAYVGTVNAVNYPIFIESVVSEVLISHEEVSFEADECDWEAMELKSLFLNTTQDSFDTYIC